MRSARTNFRWQSMSRRNDKAIADLRATAFGKKPHKEAICAKLFWQIFGRSLNDENFTRGRAKGGLNDFLNYGYAVLLSTVLQKLFGVGLDPTFGVAHVARERSTPLAYDLMEPFRPCVEWRVVQWAKDHPDPEQVGGFQGVSEMGDGLSAGTGGLPGVHAGDPGLHRGSGARVPTGGDREPAEVL